MLKRFTMATLLCGVCSFAAMPDLTRPPQTPPVPDIKMPATQQFKLPNGLTVIASPDDRLPLTTIRLTFEAGSKYDPRDLPGLSDSVAALLNQGTKTRSANQIALEAASLGGEISAASTPDSLVLTGVCLAPNLDHFFSLLADVAQNSSFPVDEVELQKQNRLQTLRAQRSEADYVAREAMAAVLFASTPYSHIGPTEKALSLLSQQKAVDFRNTYLVPNNAFLVIVGKIPADPELRKLIMSHFAGWAQREIPRRPSTPIPANAKRLIFVDRPGSVQANIMSGHITPSYGKDYFPLIMGERILGGGTNARLFMDIREKRGFAYDAHSEDEMMQNAGTEMAVTEVRNEVVGPAIDGVNQNLRAMADSDVQPVELSEAKASFAGAFILRLERQSERAKELARIQVMNLPPDFLDTFMAHVRSVEPDEIRKTGKYWTPDDATLVVVGDASKIRGAVEKFGQVQMFKPAE